MPMSVVLRTLANAPRTVPSAISSFRRVTYKLHRESLLLTANLVGSR